MMGKGVAAAILLLCICSNEAMKFGSVPRRSQLNLEAASAKMSTRRPKTQEDMIAAMSMREAFGIFTQMNHSKDHQELINLVDVTERGSKVHATREAVDRGRDLLNGIMEETLKRKEVEIVRCDEYSNSQLTILLELEQDIAYTNSESAGARGKILEASELIQINEEMEVPNTEESLRLHNDRCDTEIGTLREQLYIVKNDTEVMKNILGMLCPEEEEEEGASFLQSESTYASNTIVKCVSCMSGRQLAWLRHDRLRPLMAQLRSPEAKKYVQDNLIAEFDQVASAQPSNVKRVALTQKEILHEVRRTIPGLDIQGVQEHASQQELGACSEVLMGINGSLYRGCQTKTAEGLPCQAWSSQSPRNHTYTAERYPNDGLDDGPRQNYCRNPEGEKSTIWCFTEFGDQTWDYCDVKFQQEAPNAATKHECVESGSCKMSGGDCTRLRDRFMVILAGFIDSRNKLQDDIERVEGECSEVRQIYEYSISALMAQIEEEQGVLADATKIMTEAQQQSALSNSQHRDLNNEYHKEMTQCCENQDEATREICALKKIRGELYTMEGMVSGISDCAVTEWVDEECSKTCAGGSQVRKRSIMVFPVNGTSCPPMRMTRSCNKQACPIDCKVDDWSEFSECTALCGGGVSQRKRGKLIEPDNDGVPCPEQSETRQCNVDACNADCVLFDWADWGLCSKACEGGHETRNRKVQEEKRGNGLCAGPEDAPRMEHRICNPFDCSSVIQDANRTLLQCTAMIDLIFVIDGSASLGGYGWDMMKRTSESLVASMQGNTTGVNVGVLVFGGPRSAEDLEACTADSQETAPDIVTQCGMHWVQHLTTDMAVAESSVQNMIWPNTTTLTSMAIIEAKAELINGRQDANSIVVVITDGQPMSPIRTGEASTQLKNDARLIWIPVGIKAKMENFQNWASKPWEDSVLEIDELAELMTPHTINNVISTICPQVQ